MTQIIDDFMNPTNRINREGSNCHVGDIITWSMDKNQEQLFGKITKINKKSLNVSLFDFHIYNHQLHLTDNSKTDNVCYNNLQFGRKLMILRSIE